ncbi:uncharacterized protein LOC111061899 [Nilaparvata lugens]|uniref:uncharacterized protein LOC111061899 n=1 Tax=Nilaparvata lugens TaxID=108931 RepID=UPI00193CC5A6|nr:uncharacterized protein LOC111061899 [Nilaparvata lugens]
MNVPKYIEDLAVKILNSLNGYISNYQQTNSTETTQKTSDGKVEVSIVHNATVPKFNMNLSLPIGSFHFKDVPGIDKDIYNIQLDNTHFSKAIQFFESTALVRSCIANAESVLTPDNATTHHTFNSSYDLLTSTFDRKFAVLAKKSADGMAVKVLVGNLSLEITPTYTELNGNQIENLENGFEFPKGEPYYMFRIWRNRGQVTVYSKVLLFYLIQSPVSITLDMPVIYLGQVQGLCGNLD